MKKLFFLFLALTVSFSLSAQTDCSKIYFVNTANEVKSYDPIANTIGATVFNTPFNSSSLGLDPLTNKLVVLSNAANTNVDVYVYDPSTATGVTHTGLAPNPGANVYNRLAFSPARSIAYVFNLSNTVFTKLDFSTTTPVATSLTAVGAPPTSSNDYIGGDIVMRTKTIGYLLTSGFATGKKYFYSFTISSNTITFSLLGNTTITGSASSLAFDPAGSGNLFFNSGLNIYKFPYTVAGTFTPTLHQASATTVAFTDFASAEPPTVSVASGDQDLCNAASTFTITGNLPSKGYGSWSLVSGSGSFIGSADNATTTISVPAGNTVTVKYGIKNCSESFDNVLIKNAALPSTALAGTDATICATSYVMAANTPTIGTGTWTKLSGGGTIASVNAPNSSITGLTLGANTYKWDIASGVCPASTDTVIITVVTCPPTTDHDNDGVLDTVDVDDDNDGILDTSEGTGDNDGDGIINQYDLDSDNDGIFDVTEAGGTDLDNDGIVGNSPITVASNGLPSSLGGIPIPNKDTDSDGVPNSLDLDSDNDGIFDVAENGNASLDTDNDGVLNGTDTDGDGIFNLPGIDINITIGGTNRDPENFDGDTKPNFIDLDSDNDGIVDVVESGNGSLDANNNGIVDGADTDGDGIINVSTIDANTIFGGISILTTNTDGIGNTDYLDIDSDDDGIVDNIEGQTTTGYIVPTGVDADGDGIDNAYDVTIGFGGAGISPTNTDGTDNPDYTDTDTDNDGNDDIIEGWDLDGDDAINGAEINPAGVDSDADGLDDAFDNNNTGVNPTNGQTPISFPNVEGGTTERDWRDLNYVDHDGDGVIDISDVDDDNDGILDTDEGTGDTDGDGVPNDLDLDSDNDGIFDVAEVGGNDPDNDGIIGTGVITVSANGLPSALAGTPLPNKDTDSDGVPNSLDLDADNDGIFDITENGNASLDTDNDGILNGTDTDGDGIINLLGIDANSILGGTGSAPANFDGDTKPNFIDLDSDNDGIVDIRELGNGSLDTNTDGMVDGSDTDGDGIINVSAIDGNGSFGGTAIVPVNTDASGNTDYLDIDADNDGIVDNIEGQSTIGYVTPTNVDTDGDGIDNAYDPTVGFGGSGIPPVNTDATDTPDYIDTDSDNDGNTDIVEGWDLNGNDVINAGEVSPANLDSDNDGLDNAFDNNDTAVNPTNGQTPASFPNIEGGTTERDWRDVDFADHDTDGIPDITDIDDDNDGILDVTETMTDFDGDGVPNQYDLDSDNDGIADVIEGGSADTNGDGKIDNFTDLDNDGLDDGVAATAGNPGINVPDSDGDTHPDFLDLDSDNDGIADVLEGGSPDTNGDGLVDNFADANANGWDNTIESGTGFPGPNVPDTDGDGKPDYLDLDSDGDTVLDVVEGGSPDINNDGLVDNFTDINGNGWDDGVETGNGFAGPSVPDTNGDGIPDYQEITVVKVEVPEGFSPNGDNANDLLVIKGLSQYPNNELTILNRWGNIVFSVKGYDNTWNGKSTEGTTFSGDDLPEGTYFYILDLKNNEKPLTGFIYLNKAIK